MSTTRMPFGKHQGQPLSSLPHDYLLWLERAVEMRPWLAAGVEAELARRRTANRSQHHHHNHHPVGLGAGPCPHPDVALELVGSGLHVLARARHPEAGGTHQKMVELNRAVEWLRGVIAQGQGEVAA
jgi:hypothetical protein